jgi:hypothetical protein
MTLNDDDDFTFLFSLVFVILLSNLLLAHQIKKLTNMHSLLFIFGININLNLK